MHLRCSTEKILFCLALWLMCFTPACHHEKKEPILFGDWISLLSEKAGLTEASSEAPYFMNIPDTSEYYDAVQKAVEWNILETRYSVQPEAFLTRELAAYTLMNLADKHEKNISTKIKDIQDSQYKEYIENAVASGLMKADGRNLFHPGTVMDKEEALQLLDQVLAFVNSREIPESIHEIHFPEDEIPVALEPETINEEEKTILVKDIKHVSEGRLVTFQNGKEEKLYEVSSIEKEGEFYKIALQETNLVEKAEQIDIAGDDTIQFDDAEIIDPDGNLIQERDQSAAGKLSLMSLHGKQKTFTIGGFQVVVSAAGSSLSVRAAKKMPHGSEAYASFHLNSVRALYTLHSEKGTIKDGYLKLSFHTDEAAGMKNNTKETLYGDLSKISAAEFPAALSSVFQKQDDRISASVPVCVIRVPLPGNPVLKLNLKLVLNLSLSGKAELHLIQSHAYGFEVRNGKLRLIRDFTNHASHTLHADVKAAADMMFGIEALSGTLMDIGVEAGAEASVKAQLHLYDEEGKQRIVTTDVPADAADALSRSNPDVLVCADVNAHWILNVKLNSAASLLGKFGLYKNMALLGKNNAPLLPNMKTHMENFIFVDHCTRTDRSRIPELEQLRVTSRICISKYSLIVPAGDCREIVVIGLPEGYTLSDLVFESEDETIAEVDETGIITGKSSGNTRIVISTEDEKHSIVCHIMVPKESDHAGSDHS